MQFIVCKDYQEDHLEANTKRPQFHTRDDEIITGPGLPAFRKNFEIKEEIEKAYIRVSALGVFELYINGVRVGTQERGEVVFDELKPGFTDFHVTAFAYTYDIKPYLKKKNTIVAVVSEGWWCGRIACGAFGKNQPAFAAELTLFNTKGIKIDYETDESWESSVVGPTLAADIYDGETIDGRMPEPYEEFTPYLWHPSVKYDYKGTVKDLIGPTVRIAKEYQREPVSAVVYKDIIHDDTKYGTIVPRKKTVGYNCEKTILYPGEHLILDFAQNMVGRPEITLDSDLGTQVKVLFGEMLNDSGDEKRGCDGPKGSLYVKNYRSARATINYTTNGSIGETIYPLHTFYGFRYLDISADKSVTIEAVHGIVLTSNLKETGKLVTDSERVNRLISNIEWGRRSNYLHVPTDCPQRDERQGWSGDTQVFAGTAAYLSDIRGFMNKWIGDCRDSQSTQGGYFTDVAPHVLYFINNTMYNTAGWTDAALLIPEVLYLMYGDTDILREYYSSLEWYMKKLEENNYIGPGAKFGDWLAYDLTNQDYIALAYFIHDCDQMAKNSMRLSLEVGDAYTRRKTHYEGVAKILRERFQKRFIVGDDLTEKTQTAYILALYFELAPKELTESLISKLRKKIEENNYKLSTGFLGTSVIMLTLSKYKMNDLAYSLLLGTENPSWLYSVNQGATTVWERWNSYTLESGFGDVSMNSFNHYAYGCVLEWLYRYCAGIVPDEEKPGFEHFILAPTPDLRTKVPNGQEKIKHVCAKYDSIRGEIVSEWYYVNDVFTCHFKIPQDTSATIHFPITKDVSNLTIQINGVSYWIGELCGNKRDGYFEFELPAGEYTIQ